MAHSENYIRFLNPFRLHLQKMELELKCAVWYVPSIHANIILVFCDPNVCFWNVSEIFEMLLILICLIPVLCTISMRPGCIIYMDHLEDCWVKKWIKIRF